MIVALAAILVMQASVDEQDPATQHLWSCAFSEGAWERDGVVSDKSLLAFSYPKNELRHGEWDQELGVNFHEGFDDLPRFTETKWSYVGNSLSAEFFDQETLVFSFKTGPIIQRDNQDFVRTYVDIVPPLDGEGPRMHGQCAMLLTASPEAALTPIRSALGIDDEVEKQQ